MCGSVFCSRDDSPRLASPSRVEAIRACCAMSSSSCDRALGRSRMCGCGGADGASLRPLRGSCLPLRGPSPSFAFLTEMDLTSSTTACFGGGREGGGAAPPLPARGGPAAMIFASSARLSSRAAKCSCRAAAACSLPALGKPRIDPPRSLSLFTAAFADGDSILGGGDNFTSSDKPEMIDKSDVESLRLRPEGVVSRMRLGFELFPVSLSTFSRRLRAFSATTSFSRLFNCCFRSRSRSMPCSGWSASSL
mmetsp:Transcript_30570/g.97549  ORF Transcript_30570/g.97549 Transcript_30570/m.97549 type:complete len:250 (+) Transcript_30570:1380-2129(+)